MAERKIAENRKAFHEYFIEDRFEAGIVLVLLSYKVPSKSMKTAILLFIVHLTCIIISYF
jgi:tmRNA-binding protein